MNIDRRGFLTFTALTTAGASALLAQEKEEEGAEAGAGASSAAEDAAKEQVGCLVDTTLCIGCRQCEAACNRRNALPRPEVPFFDRRVLRDKRRMTVDAFTVVNEFPGAPSATQAESAATFVKIQCMHCLDPACVSACIVGALTKARDGAVVYNKSICIGCRYCMVACPFQVPAYEYDDALAPRVRKCEMCTDAEAGTGADPACAAACPTEAIVFGKRAELLELARARIEAAAARYRPVVYGEHEVGGTAWLYLVGREPRELDLLDLPQEAPPRTTEAIQHGIFRFGALPIAVYGALGALMWYHERAAAQGEEPPSRPPAEGDEEVRS